MVTPLFPEQLTPFVGRADELADIARLLSDPHCRLLTLVGPGGIGKTRLALQATSLQQGIYADGVYFVPLQGVSAPPFLMFAIADALSFQFFQDHDARRQLLNYLCDKHLLLVLDNFEHLLEGVDAVSAILAAAPRLKIMVTSREALHLQEEWLYRIAGLHVPYGELEIEVESYSAVQLFMQGARRLRADISLAAERRGVVRICQLVDGMPLGIELAASWVHLLSAEDIAGEIERDLDMLETPLRNVEPRHRRMRTVLEQSWQRLSQAEQAIFNRLAVFCGGCTREAAQKVAGASLKMLAALMDRSFLCRDEAGRYRLHELLREYAEEKLNEMPEEAARTRERHCAYYADFLSSLSTALQGQSQKEALRLIEADIENVRAAWDWAIGHRLTRELDRALDSLCFFLRYPQLVSRRRAGLCAGSPDTGRSRRCGARQAHGAAGFHVHQPRAV